MKRNLFLLLKIQWLIWWRGVLDKGSVRRSKAGLLLMPLLLLSFVPFIGIMGATYYGLYMAGQSAGQGHVAITFALTIGQVACLTFGIFYVVSAFYYSKDLNILVPLPLRPSEILLAKFLAILTGEYLTLVPFVLPALVVHGIWERPGPLFVPFAVVVFLLLPVLPLVFSALFSLVLMRLTNLSRNRDLWRVGGALCAIAMGLGFNYMSRIAGSRGATPGQSAQQFLAANPNLVAMMGRYFPTSVWGTEALRAGAFTPLAAFVATALASLAVMLWAAEKLFYGGLLGGNETRPSGRTLTAADLTRETARVRSPQWAMLLREIRLLNRTPSFLMAALVPVIVMPVFMVLPMIQGRELGRMAEQFGKFAGSPLLPVVGMGTTVLLNTMTNLAPTSISREGRYFWISRAIPVPPHVQIHAKAFHNLLFSLLSIALVVGVYGFLGLLRPLTLAYVVLGSLAGAAVSTYAGILIDLYHPNLKWTDPQQAMKGNMNGLYGLLLALGVAAAGGAVTFVAYMLARPLVSPLLIVVFGLGAFVLARIAGTLADQRYLEIED